MTSGTREVLSNLTRSLSENASSGSVVNKLNQTDNWHRDGGVDKVVNIGSGFRSLQPLHDIKTLKEDLLGIRVASRQ